ncbi:hypothetical protein PR202_ga31480 [Eleusine coracana subsp. coracana]|uniref:X8 domain-containing protein n=1 Tax=Eleusine coracana subsp. coracana TaxID=191504 RepID=A0AAV5DRJ6_ELECO|nr:hypothetical protein QOZ80_3AG0229920 [Eleusine coracana subsp. coracana]GJN13143.1 hypothetical protein PR202_ga31480 [Eleusine coracana subsp. coracana]
MEAALVLVAGLLLVSSALVASEFCVCRSDQPTAVLQKAIDFSCGDGADCTAILDGGSCYNPNNVASHCSWAANSYYQNNKAKGATCDFNGAATISTTDPSFSGCTFPSTASTAGFTSTTTGGGATTGTLSPGFGTGTNGTGMGSSSLGPTGTSGFDSAAAAGLLPCIQFAAFLAIAILSFLAL